MEEYLTNDILEKKSAAIRALMDEHNISYEWYEHKPVLSYEDAEEVAAETGYTGTESKSLFLRGKKTGGYYIFFTLQGEKMDSKTIKELTGEKINASTAAYHVSNAAKESVGATGLKYASDQLVF